MRRPRSVHARSVVEAAWDLTLTRDGPAASASSSPSTCATRPDAQSRSSAARTRRELPAILIEMMCRKHELFPTNAMLHRPMEHSLMEQGAVRGARWDPAWDTVEAWRSPPAGGAGGPGNDAWWVYGVCGFAVAFLGHRVL